MTAILGLSAFYHDSAAALVVDGRIAAAAQEERFTRKKHDAAFPAQAVRYCVEAGGIDLNAVDLVVFYDKPFVKFERLLETYLSHAPRGWRSFTAAMPVWLREKLYLKSLLRKELRRLGRSKHLPAKLLFTEHHQSHAASAFYPSPFDSAAVLCLDGVGEWASTSAWLGEGADLRPLWEQRFPHSLGLLYSAFTYYLGFKVNSGEYKVMGLAPYGEARYRDRILDELVDLKPDGSFRLNMKYFDFATGLRMTGRSFDRLFGGPARLSESALDQKHMDIAASVQAVTEEVVLRLGNALHQETRQANLCLAGGVALNCVANGRLLREGRFERIWVQPAAGDAGGALGAALTAWHLYCGGSRSPEPGDSMQGALLGPGFTADEARQRLDRVGAIYRWVEEHDLLRETAQRLTAQQVIGWFQGRMEYGPRALGGRSILADARSPAMQSVMNQKIKFRESFRPFAPAVLAEDVTDYFDGLAESPYMLFVAPVTESRRHPMSADDPNLDLLGRLKMLRSEVPAVTHVDYSARVQTVSRQTNPRFYNLLRQFKALTGCPLLVNTSFNVRGEPIVCTPEDAYRCFMRTHIDTLVVENFLLDKRDQPVWAETQDWRQEFALD